MVETNNTVQTRQSYEFAKLSPGEIQDLKTAEDKINQGKAGEVVILAYEKK